MAVLKNTRNILLANALIRVEGASVTIGTGGFSSIAVPASSNLPVPSSLTLTATTTLYKTPTFLWEFRYGTSGNWTTVTGTTNTVTITLDSAWLTAAGTNVVVQYRVTAQESGINTTTNTITIPILRNAQNGITLAYTNDSLNVPVSLTNIATWTASGGIAQVYDGVDLLLLESNIQSTTFPTNTGYYVLDITKISGDTLTEPLITGSGTSTATFGNWGGTLLNPTVYRITAYIKTKNGATLAVATDVNIKPLKNGEDAVVYYISTSSPVIVKQAENAATAGTHSSISIQGKKVVGSTTTNYGWVTVTPNGGTEAATATDTSTAPVYLAPANTDGKSFYTIRLYNQATVSGATKLDEDEVIQVVFKGNPGQNGVNAVSVNYSNDNLNVPIDANNIANWTASGGRLQVFDGDTLLTLNSTTQSTTTPAASGEYVIEISRVSGDTLGEPSISYNSATKLVTLSDWSGTLTTSTVYRITAYVKTLIGTSVSIYRDITIIPSRDATIYYIDTDTDVIVKDSPDVITAGSHSTVTIRGKKVVGNTTINYGWITVTPNGGTEAATATDTSSSAITLAPGNSDGKLNYTVRMYNQATVSGATQLDIQLITVVFKGATGTPGAPAKGIDIGGSTNVSFKLLNSVYTPASVTLSASPQNLTAPSYQWTISGGSFSSGSSVTSTTGTSVTVYPTSSTSVTVNLTATDAGVQYNKAVVFSVVTDGIGQDGKRTSTGYIYYYQASATAPGAPSTTGVTYTFATGVFSGGAFATGTWSTQAPQYTASNTNKYWAATYTAVENTAAGGTSTGANITIGTVQQTIGFTGLVTFTSANAVTDGTNGLSFGPTGQTQIDGGKITTGLVVADRIDGRGLVIKDALGNVILGAGNALSWSYINSTYPSSIANSSVTLGTLGFTGDTDAQRNNRITINANGQLVGIGTGDSTAVANSQITLSSSGVLSGAGGGSVTLSGLGAKNFAFLDQLTSGNISTYIASGAITNAYIGNQISSTNFDGTINASGTITGNGTVGWAIGKGGNAVFNTVTIRGKITTTASSPTRVDVGAGVGPYSDHNGISLSGDNYNNCFIRRDSDGAVFFNINPGSGNALSYNSVSGILSVRGDIEASTIKTNVVTTNMIQGFQVTESYYSTSTGSSVTIYFTVPVVSGGITAIFVDYGLGFGSGDKYASPNAVLTDFSMSNSGGTHVGRRMWLSPISGSWSVTVTRANYSGDMQVSVLVLKR